MNKKQRLELTWVGKNERPRLEPRILLEETDKSYHSQHRVGNDDIFDNRLIFGDNLLALKALEQEFTGKIKCIYIDPPFNTQQAFEHYEDGLEHSSWLSMMRDRLQLLHQLLHDSGSCFVHIDDNELGYLLVLMDEIFGRANRVSVICFKQSSVSGPKAINPGLVTTANFILYYVKNRSKWSPNRVYVATSRDTRYSKYIVNPDEPYSQWRLENLRNAFARSQGIPVRELADVLGDQLEEMLSQFVLANPSRIVRTARVAPKDVNEEARKALNQSQKAHNKVFRSQREDKDDYYFLNGEQLLFYSSKVKLIDGQYIAGEPASNIWGDLLSNNLHKEGGVSFPNGKKPELLLKRIIEIATEPGDIVLDSFAGSGTTGAVAHKMKRRWVMVELGEHCETQILPRLRRVIDDVDPDGATKATGWKGGGGFRYHRLAPSLLEKDRWGNWIISQKYNPEMLAEAMCKLMGFTYAPSETVYWQHGYSTERDYLYVTTTALTHDQLKAINEDVGENRSLLICCKAFKANLNAFQNLTVKKIPKAVLSKCEWGKDDYSLNVVGLKQLKSAARAQIEQQLSLLDDESRNENAPASSTP